ncbi:MAG: hypothetical protein Ct9H300mP12_14020 [Acidimicrobiales bacterium]|nr:MAG: hypothetical protein Ct9H300mP12_14020 [Acidimicrobiales bacterium]
MTDGNTGTTVVYWRKMCGFCARLLGELEQAGVDVELRDIWEDPEAAALSARERGGRDGPTVVLPDGRAITNPPPDALIAHLTAGS